MLTVHWNKASNRRRAGHTDGHGSVFSHLSKILQRTFAKVLTDIGSMQKGMEGTVTYFPQLAFLRRGERTQTRNRS